MLRLSLILAALLIAVPAAADNRSQLERSIRLSQDEAGLYSLKQLVAIKDVLEDDSLNENNRKRRIEGIKRKGAGPGGGLRKR